MSVFRSGVVKKNWAYLDGVQETEFALGRVVEVLLPLGQRLETVHHGSVITVGGGGDDEEKNPEVQEDDTVSNEKLVFFESNEQIRAMRTACWSSMSCWDRGDGRRLLCPGCLLLLRRHPLCCVKLD